MASLLLDKLEALKSNEIKLKEERRALEEELELEMEKKRRLKMEATLTKLEVQVDDLDNDLNSMMVRNNISTVKTSLNITRNQLSSTPPTTAGREALEQAIRKIDIEIAKMRDIRGIEEITVKEFKNNVSSICEENKKKLLNNMFHGRRRGSKLRHGLKELGLELEPEIKIYDDIIPLFRTMIGIMAKQQRDIDELKNRV